jgi:hypothetical protein
MNYFDNTITQTDIHKTIKNLKTPARAEEQSSPFSPWFITVTD